MLNSDTYNPYKLNTCPFCDKLHLAMTIDYDYKYIYIQCKHCKCCGPNEPLHITGSGAILPDQSEPIATIVKKWNTRL